MTGNRRGKRRRAFVLILLFLVLSGFNFFVSPHIRDKAGEGETVSVSASAPAQSETVREETSPSEEDKVSTVDKSSEYLILVNKTHGLGKNYEPEDLKNVNSVAGDRDGKYQKMRRKAANAFNRLTKAAKREGHIIKLTSGYRPYSYQQVLYRQYVKEDGKNRAEQYSAKPGYSEHQTGLVADVSSPSVNYNLVQAYGNTAEGKWLAKNAHEYGFIIRYPKGKEDITGYEYEPWHLRYVGKDAAAEIYSRGVTLEEYLGES